MNQTTGNLRQEYYEYIVNIVATDHTRVFFEPLFNKLASISVPGSALNFGLDSNRIADAIYARKEWVYRNCNEWNDEYNRYICTGFDECCTALELLVGMAVRMNELMTWALPCVWFTKMCENCGIWAVGSVTSFDEVLVESLFKKAVNRDYEADGSCGGFFCIPNYPYDMRTTDLWYQMHAYMDYLNCNRIG